MAMQRWWRDGELLTSSSLPPNGWLKSAGCSGYACKVYDELLVGQYPGVNACCLTGSSSKLQEEQDGLIETRNTGIAKRGEEINPRNNHGECHVTENAIHAHFDTFHKPHLKL